MRELKSLGRVNCHQSHLIIIFGITTILIGHQGYVLKEVNKSGRKPLFTISLYEILHGRKEFVKILLTRHILGIRAGIDIRRYSAHLDYFTSQVKGIIFVKTLGIGVDKRSEIRKLSQCSLCDTHSIF